MRDKRRRGFHNGFGNKGSRRMHSVAKACAFLAAALAFGGEANTAAAADGTEVFNNNCAVCHATEPGTNKLGPSLAGVVGRKAGSVGDYSYSPAMSKLDVTWDKTTLDKYVADPQAMVPGTKMLFPGLKDEGDRKAVIDYLATLQR
jgi:cytochrome c